MVATGTLDSEILELAATVNDPEIPVLSIRDLGILRDGHLDGPSDVGVVCPHVVQAAAIQTMLPDWLRGRVMVDTAKTPVGSSP